MEVISKPCWRCGAEASYRPLDSNWAFGLDANYVKQRDCVVQKI
ncbi:YjbH domain-containing protein [Escherichia coli]